MIETDLQYGQKVRIEPGTSIYSIGDPLSNHPIYYVIAGLIRIGIPLSDGSIIPVYHHPDSVFGVVESLLDCILYRWDREGFDVASSVSWELALETITGMTRTLRIMNAEFGDRIQTD